MFSHTLIKSTIVKNLFTLLFCALFAFSCAPQTAQNDDFVRVEDGQFIRGGKPYYFVGTNFWYGAILASEGEGGDRERLAAELDKFEELGIDNLRILVGADGENGVPSKVEPTLQYAPGEYNDEILDGLDYLMAELARRGMTAVLYLNNSWEWSGGYTQYLAWATGVKAPVPSVDGWDKYMEFARGYIQSEPAKKLFADHVDFIISRTNRYTGVKYIDDPTIFSWQIGNEPRAFSEENKEPFAEWIKDVADQIRSLDPNHMISTGSEGSHGCETDLALCERIHSYDNISYVNCHIWPFNWGWIKPETMAEDIAVAKENTTAYIANHLAISERLAKPLVVEEFGFPRNGKLFSKDSSVTLRDEYYGHIFSQIEESAREGGLFAGCNFWGWGGQAETNLEDHIFWKRGDDYTGDPAQEEQGLNSVFSSDISTLQLIERVNGNLRDIVGHE